MNLADCQSIAKLILSLENYNYIEAGEWRFRWPTCPEGGCSYQLAIQLIVTMVGKQIFSNCTEFISVLNFTWLKRKFSKCKKVKYHDYSKNATFEIPISEYTMFLKICCQCCQAKDDNKMYSQWEHDYSLKSGDGIVTGKLKGGSHFIMRSIKSK